MTVVPYRAAPDTASWPHCDGALPGGVECRGRRVEPHTACLAHLPGDERSAYLAGLRPGADLDHRGTRFTEELLSEVLTALTEPSTRRPRIGQARFERATFRGDVRFDLAEFDADAVFDGAKIAGDISFDQAEISGRALFRQVKIDGNGSFDRMRVRRRVVFERAEIDGNAWFDRMNVGGRAVFDGAKIGRDACFRGMEIGGYFSFDQVGLGGDARFDRARVSGSSSFSGLRVGGQVSFLGAAFERAALIGPMVCGRTLNLSEAVFGGAVTMEAAAAAVRCWRTRWASTAALRLRYAAVDLSDAVVEYPLSITARSRPFIVDGEELDEPGLMDAGVRVMSLRGVDAAHLLLTGVDLTECLFAGTVHLDQLRLEGRYTLAAAPSGLRRRGMRPVRWTPRRTLAEEHHWRAARGWGADGWTPAPRGEEVQEPAALAPVYRQLRKAFEDGKHEPGAADFYYGEMEMRRHADDIPWTERSLLTAYWALSGYGLRASRALGWLMVAMTATVLAMMLWGLPQNDPRPKSTGTVADGSITMTTDVPGPVNPEGPYDERLTTGRFEKSLRAVVNSVIFRSSDQKLTTAGTYTEMASRLVEPALLGLAVLAIRGRLKR